MHWFALRVSYSRIFHAHDVLTENGIETYMPTRTEYKEVDGKRRKMRKPLITNIIFAHSTKEDIDKVIEKTGKEYFNYYYDKTEKNEFGNDTILIVPDKQMENFIELTSMGDRNFKIAQNHILLKLGDKVRVINGKFKGIEGNVVRYANQQRVAVVLPHLCVAVTTYVPTIDLEKI